MAHCFDLKSAEEKLTHRRRSTRKSARTLITIFNRHNFDEKERECRRCGADMPERKKRA